MAQMTFIAKNVKRSDGKNIVAAIAYRAGDKLTDDKGIVHDYSNRAKKSVAGSEIFLPTDAPEWAYDRGKLWRAANSAERKKNAVTGREFVVNLPYELDDKQRRELVSRYAKEIVKRHGCAVDAAIHRPDRKGDQRNHHAHIMLSTRRLDALGFGEKTRELDTKKNAALDGCRALWAQYTNEALAAAGIDASIDHRSYRRQGINRIPGWHLGNWQTQQERGGIRTEAGDHNRKVAIINAVRSATAWEFVGFTLEALAKAKQAPKPKEVAPVDPIERFIEICATYNPDQARAAEIDTGGEFLRIIKGYKAKNIAIAEENGERVGSIEVYNALTRNNLLNPDNAWLLDEISASVTAYDAATPEPLSPAPRAALESSAEQEQKVEQKAEQERNNRPDW
jgi:hypothetical protein